MNLYDRIEYAAGPPERPTLGELVEYIEKESAFRVEYDYDIYGYAVTVFRSEPIRGEPFALREWVPRGDLDPMYRLETSLCRWIRDNIGRR